MNPEHKHHFNKCVECGKEPDLTYTPLTSEVTLSCPGQCARLCITCIGFDLAETLWNAANPEFHHGPPSRQEIADALKAMVAMHPDWTDRQLAEAGACSIRTIQKIREKLNSEKPEENPLSYQVGGDHYSRLDYQPIELIHDLGLDFDRANAVKYLARLGHKGDPLEDIQKVRQYLQFYNKCELERVEKTKKFAAQVPQLEGLVIRAVCVGAIDAAEALLGSLEMKYRELQKENKDENSGRFFIEKVTLADGRVAKIQHDLSKERKVPLFCCGYDGGNMEWCCVKRNTNCTTRPYLLCEHCTCPNKEAQK